MTHSFTSFSAAAAEAENSVVWGGIHFRFDVTAGQTLGQSVAQFVDQNFFQPHPGNGHHHGDPDAGQGDESPEISWLNDGRETVGSGPCRSEWRGRACLM